jgi:hypothetical protein
MRQTPRQWGKWVAVVFCAGLAASCGGKSSSSRWKIVTSQLPEAVLAIAGRSERDIWAVGADQGSGPLALHYDGTAWTRVATGSRGTLWWTQSFSDGTTMMAGAQSTILVTTDGVTFTRQHTPGLANATVFGLWGAASNDVYAVGGIAGRDGFVWHFDGSAWTEVDLGSVLPPNGLPATDLGDWPGFFKVWGDPVGRVYVVGGRGVLLRRAASSPFEIVPTDATDSTLFTVHGTVFGAVAVGGGDSGRILEASATGGVKDVTPPGAPLIQGVAVDLDGNGYASGASGAIYARSSGGTWRVVDTKLALPTIESLHAVWIDPAGGVWTGGGNVVTSALDHGAILHFGAHDVATYVPASSNADGGSDSVPPATCPPDQIDPAPQGSIARRWNEQAVGAIRRDLPRPTVHARNLYHVSAAMWDAWAAYDGTAHGVFTAERQSAADVAAARAEAISYAAYDLLMQRYRHATGGATSAACFRAFMAALGYDPDDAAATGDTPRALGNRIAQAIIAATIDDGSNQANNYADTTGYAPVNSPLVIDQPGVTLTDPNHWQELNLSAAETQNGIITPAGVQAYIGSNWSLVPPFALARPAPDAAYLDAGPPPAWDQPEMQAWIADLLGRSAALDITDGMTIDVSPGAYGNNTLGANDGAGRPVNPVTGAPYAPQVVLRGDFARVMAEFWADGPKSETPPGHWFVIANSVADNPATTRQLFGAGDPLDPLAWDVHVYLALGGAVHDAAIAAWEQKRLYTALRPISTVRYLAQRGQSTEADAPDYDPHGLPLIPGVVERITAERAAPGQRHAHLASFVGQLAVKSWRGEPGDRASEVGGVGWIRAIDWIPYQRRTFVTPAFPGFVSGHSTFSRAAAEVLAALTGSPFFPGGLGEVVAPAGSYLVFEDGPSAEVRLQWATYFDASDQAGQSRIFGGIHLQPDDFQGRIAGSAIGKRAVDHARLYFDGTARP